MTFPPGRSLSRRVPCGAVADTGCSEANSCTIAPWVGTARQRSAVPCNAVRMARLMGEIVQHADQVASSA